MENQTFIPGSEWVFFKIYTGKNTADEILKNELIEYIKDLSLNSCIDKWFFIRYSDPDFHIRLRLHLLKNSYCFNTVFLRFFYFFQPLIENNLIWNIQCDTYQREISRYGANTISLVEEIFFVDSEHIINLLLKTSKKNSDYSWQLALVLIDSFMTAFSIQILQRKELMSQLADNLKKEFGLIHHQSTKQLNLKYRLFRKEIENVMLWENDDNDIMDIIKSRCKTINPFAATIIELKESGELQVPFQSLITSMIHMTMNRYFTTKNRLHELVIYEFLSKFYSSEIAKYNKKHSLSLYLNKMNLYDN